MATVLLASSYKDDFELHSFLITATPVTGMILLYADRTLVIDSITFGVNVVGSGTSTLQVAKTTGGTLTTPSLATPALITGGTALHTAVSTDTTTATLTPALLTPASDTNVLKAGNWLGLIVAGTATNVRGVVQIRFRSRVV